MCGAAAGVVGSVGSSARRRVRRYSRALARAGGFRGVGPRDAGERGLWVGVSLAAAVSEEVTYRGVMYALLLRLTHDPLTAAVATAALFGAAHAVQGARGVLAIGAISLGLQGLVLLAGSLYVAMRRYDFPTAPGVVGMILGPLAEAQLRNALSIGEGRWTVFLDRPMSATLLGVVVLVLVLPRAIRMLRQRA